MALSVGSYVVHTKLADLGSGEIMKSELGVMTIRFASGLRNFSEVIVGRYLEKTTVAPVIPLPVARRNAARKRPA